ncbi:MAG: aminotransferase [Spirochaetaceae bacterium]|jgi:aspartate/methionine/tyrosine aminotransferase|nr:aminotransferase [Spirochaetaceae bacterium]
MKLPAFGVEDWLNTWEKKASLDISQSTVAAFTLEELLGIDGKTSVGDFFSAPAKKPLDYGWIEGSPEFKELVAGLYKNVAPENVLQTNGATGANLLVLLGLIEKGDHVIALYPSYQQHYDIPRSLGAEVSMLPLLEERGWNPDIDELKSLIRKNTKLIVLNNANNPTGTIIEEPVMLEIAAAARKVGAWILVDEVFQSLDNAVKMTPIADLYERGISTNSISKTYSVPGIRIGWTASGSEAAAIFRSLRDYTLICAGVLDNILAEHVLRNRAAVMERNRRIVLQNLSIFAQWVEQEPRVSVVMPRAVPVSFVKLDIPQDTEQFCVDLLRDTGVLLVPGSRFGVEGHARLGYCAHTETLRAGLDALSGYLCKFDG